MALRERNMALLAKIETTLGAEPDPVPAVEDALAIEDLQFSPNVNMVQTNEKTGSLDMSAPIVGGMRAGLSFSVLMRGSGAAGTAPPWGKLLTACGWKETVTAAAVPASAEACAAGSTTSATLSTGAAGTAQAYRGMPLRITGTPSGANGIHPISSYTAGKVATLATLAGGTIGTGSNYQVLANVLYSPHSDPALDKSLTFWALKDGKRIKLHGARGSASFEGQAGGVWRARFEFMGMFGGEDDFGIPAGIVAPTVVPPVWRGGAALIERSPAAVNSFSLNASMSLAMSGNPNLPEGFDYPEGTSRDMMGSIDPLDTLVGTRNTMDDFRTGARRILLAQWGATAGNRFALTVPAAMYNQPPRDQEREGQSVRALGFKATGDDAGAFLACY